MALDTGEIYIHKLLFPTLHMLPHLTYIYLIFLLLLLLLFQLRSHQEVNGIGLTTRFHLVLSEMEGQKHAQELLRETTRKVEGSYKGFFFFFF